MIQEELKSLVSNSVKTLGLAIREIHGEEIYNDIEIVRKRMKLVRGKDAEIVQKAMDEVYKKLHAYEKEDLRLIAKAFSLMLELINACEAAYRVHRLKGSKHEFAKHPDAIIYVFTSHPTESRSSHFLKLMSQTEDLLQEGLENGFESIEERLAHYMRIAVRLDIANNKRPEVKDEIQEIFHTVLSPEILSEQCALMKKGIPVSFRTWVGGDKDGHPKVGHVTMLQSLSLSRAKLVEYLEIKFKTYLDELTMLPLEQKFVTDVRVCMKNLHALKKIGRGDGKKVEAFKSKCQKLLENADQRLLTSPILEEISNLIWLYPAIVLPLEIREDSSLIRNAVKDAKEPISLMLKELKTFSAGLNPKWYVRGFIISMCMTSEDYLAAVKITKRELGSMAIPIVPLFENEKGLKHGKEILSGAMEKEAIIKNHLDKWGGRFEVMVGYSDSSKENGVLSSRMMVEAALYDLEKFLHSKKLTPVFFHGSGGSTSRGGGTVQEQLAWWPQSALDIYKVTIQGEMVQRNFNHGLIMRSQVSKILQSYNDVKPKKPERPDEMTEFTDEIQKSYRELVNDPSFQSLTSAATPYDYLNLLRIGSRPSKRAAPGKFSLRAIPWILCWTQTRLLLPVWWGVGSAWNSMDKKQKEIIKNYASSSPLMKSYLKNLGFTIARIEPGVWNFHLRHSKLPEAEKKIWEKRMTEELKLSEKFFHEITGEKDFTWFRPWLGESIYFRSSMIHPLNVIQKISLEQNDHVLLRETVTGIACGMLTTG